MIYCLEDQFFVLQNKLPQWSSVNERNVLLLDMGYNSSEEQEIAHELQQIEQATEVNITASHQSQ